MASSQRIFLLALILAGAIAQDVYPDDGLGSLFEPLGSAMDFDSFDQEFNQMNREMHQLEMSAGRHGVKSFSESESQEITEVNGKVHEKDTKCVNGKCKERVSNHRAMHAHMPAHMHDHIPARIPAHMKMETVPAVLAETSSTSMHALIAGTT